MPLSSGLAQFQNSYEISPIILTGGIAANLTGGMLPIISLTQPNSFSGGVTSSADVDPNTIARFRPMPGSTLEDIDIGQYAFANQTTAANAIIFKPIKISLMMTAPAPAVDGGYSAKIVAFTTLKMSLDQHMLAGGLFTVATPAFIYANCVLRKLTDITPPDNPQVQAVWQWEFDLPLVTLAAAQAAQNSLMSKVTNGLQTDNPPAQSSPTNATGNPSSLVAPVVVPSVQSPVGGSVQAFGPGSALAGP